MSCQHPNFFAAVSVNRIEDVGRFVAEVTIHCAACDKPFQFLGVEPGFNYAAPTAALDGLTVSLPICPEGERPNPLQELQGFPLGGHN